MLWLVALASAADRPAKWTGRFAGCDRIEEVTTHGSMHLGVRFATSNPALVTEFGRAMNFWAGIIEMEWHEENSRGRVIQVVDGSAELFKRSVIARAQLPGTPTFRGAIAFNKKISWSSRSPRRSGDQRPLVRTGSFRLDACSGPRWGCS